MIGFLISVLMIMLLAGAGYYFWHRKVVAEIVEGAEIEWHHFNKVEPEFIEGIDEVTFNAVYHRVHMPRFPGYALAAFASFAAALPIIFILLAGLLLGAEAIGVIPEPVDVADQYFIRDGRLVLFRDAPPEAALYYIRDLGGFYYFFGVLLSWLGIVWFFTRRYHSRRPGYLRDELIRART